MESANPVGGCSARACVRVLARGGGGGGGGGARSSDVASCAFFLRARVPKFSFRQRFVQDPPRPSPTDRPTRSGFSPAPRGSAGDRQRLPSWLQPGNSKYDRRAKIESQDLVFSSSRRDTHVGKLGRSYKWEQSHTQSNQVPVSPRAKFPGYHKEGAGPGCGAPRVSRQRSLSPGASITVMPGVGTTPPLARATVHLTREGVPEIANVGSRTTVPILC